MAPFTNDPGNETTTATLEGVPVDPHTLAGYGVRDASGNPEPDAQWTIRDDGLVENLVAGSDLTHPAPSGLQTWVGGVVRQTIGTVTVAPAPDQPVAEVPPAAEAPEATPQPPQVEVPPSPAIPQAARDGVATPAPVAAVPEVAAPEVAAPVLAPTPKVSLHPIAGSTSVWVRIEHVGGEVEHEILASLQAALTRVEKLYTAHFRRVRR